MTRVWILFLVLALLVPVVGYYLSCVNFPAYRYRVWLKTAETGYGELRQQDLKEAEQLYARALRIADNYPNATIEQGISELGLAEVAMAANRYDNACEYYARALKKISESAGPRENHSALLFKAVDCLLGLAGAYGGLQNSASANEKFEEALFLTQFLPEQVSATRVEVLNQYASYLQKIKKTDLAQYINLRARCEQIETSTIKIDAEQKRQMDDLTVELLEFASTAEATKSVDKAKWAYLEADKLFCKLHGADSPARFTTLFNLGKMLETSSKKNDAMAVYQQLLPILEKSGPQSADQLFLTLKTIGTMLILSGDNASAVPYLDKAVAVAKGSTKDDPNRLALAYFFKAEALKWSSQFAEAEKAYALALQIRRKHPILDYPNLADILFHFGDSRLKEKRYVEAEAFFRQSLAAHDPNPNKPEQVSLIKFELAKSLEYQGKREQAIKTYKEIVDGCTNANLFNRDNALEQSQTALKALNSNVR